MGRIDDVMELGLLFFFLAICAWLAESAYASIRGRSLKNAGILAGPYLPLYGLGGSLIYLADRSFSASIPAGLLLALYLVLVPLLEAALCLAAQKLLTLTLPAGLTEKPKILGFLSLPRLGRWAIFILAMLFILEPFFRELILGMPARLGYFLCGFGLALLLVDIAVYAKSMLATRRKGLPTRP